MQIQLKQAEIITALKQYISSKGIDLTGKDVKIAFTAGRKESGLSADLSIEDCDIPGFSDPEPEAKVASSADVLPLVAPAAKEKTKAAEPTEEKPPQSATDAEPAKMAKSVSLFS